MSFIERIGDGPSGRKRLGALVALLLLAAASLTLTTVVLLGDSGGEGDPPPQSAFGNSTICGEYSAKVRLLRSGGAERRENETEVASPLSPTVLLEDGFESGNLDTWSDWKAVTVDNESAHEGNFSAHLDPKRPWGWSGLKEEGAIAFSEGNRLHLYLALLITDHFEVDLGSEGDEVEPECIGDFFVAKLKFDNGKTLVYLLGGAYTERDDERAVDLRSEVEPAEWTALEIEDIQNDYEAQFEEKMPSGGDLIFLARSASGSARLDGILLKTVPETTRGNYWVSGEDEVGAYYASVSYLVNISEQINASNVWAEIKLWSSVYNESGISRDVSFMQDALINVTTFGVWRNWTSASFSLPESDEVHGSVLTYIFDIRITLFGQIAEGEIGAGDWVSVSDAKEDFDRITVRWINYSDYIGVVIGTVVASLGVTGLAYGASRLRKKRGDCPCAGKPGCECDL